VCVVVGVLCSSLLCSLVPECSFSEVHTISIFRVEICSFKNRVSYIGKI
jgi:hypothetical protein